MAQVTAQDIMDLFPLIEGEGWYINEAGQVRNARMECPICALMNELDGGEHKFQLSAWSAWVVVTNTPVPEALEEIVRAADFSYVEPARKALLAALKISGEA